MDNMVRITQNIAVCAYKDYSPHDAGVLYRTVIGKGMCQLCLQVSSDSSQGLIRIPISNGS